MGGEQVVHPTAGQRVDYKERRGRRVSLSGIVWDFFRYAGDFDERRSECVGPAADVRAKIVSSILARAADRHLNNHGGERRHISMSTEPTMLRPLLLSRLPPRKNMANCASMEMAPAMVAVIVIVSVS